MTDTDPGDPSAMGEPEKLPPMRKFRIYVEHELQIDARSVRDAMDLARAKWGGAFTGRVEAL